MSALSPPLSSPATSCSVDHNRIEVLTSATIEGTLWCVSPFVQSLPCLAYYEQTRVKFILFSIVFQCLLFKERRALQFSILFPCFISLAKDKLIKMFLTTNETMMMIIILNVFFSLSCTWVKIFLEEQRTKKNSWIVCKITLTSEDRFGQ